MRLTIDSNPPMVIERDSVYEETVSLRIGSASVDLDPTRLAELQAAIDRLAQPLSIPVPEDRHVSFLDSPTTDEPV